jgi:hypothetical protein
VEYSQAFEAESARRSLGGKTFSGQTHDSSFLKFTSVCAGRIVSAEYCPESLMGSLVASANIT